MTGSRPRPTPTRAGRRECDSVRLMSRGAWSMAGRLAASRKAEATKGTKGRPALFDGALDVTVSAPNHVFVHGRGVYAELGGSLHASGTTSRLAIASGIASVK